MQSPLSSQWIQLVACPRSWLTKKNWRKQAGTSTLIYRFVHLTFVCFVCLCFARWVPVWGVIAGVGTEYTLQTFRPQRGRKFWSHVGHLRQCACVRSFCVLFYSCGKGITSWSPSRLIYSDLESSNRIYPLLFSQNTIDTSKSLGPHRSPRHSIQRWKPRLYGRLPRLTAPHLFPIIMLILMLIETHFVDRSCAWHHQRDEGIQLQRCRQVVRPGPPVQRP